jgi:starch-binding outer membrane protein, SusD/RagB family
MNRIHTAGRWLKAASLSLLTVGSVACGTDLLTVQNPPSLVSPETLQNATGVQNLLNSARHAWGYYGYGFRGFYTTPMTDEEYVTYSYELALDQRSTAPGASDNYWFSYYAPGARVSASTAIEFIDQYAPQFGDSKSEMYTIRAELELGSGEDMCPGYTFNELLNGVRVYGQPMTVAEYFDYALKDADSAKKYLNPDSTRLKHWSSVIRARILVNQGKFAEAAAEVASVPTSFVFRLEYNGDQVADYGGWNYDAYYRVWDLSEDYGNVFTMADNEGGNGLPFISSSDPRIKPTPSGDQTYSYGPAKSQMYAPKIWVDTKGKNAPLNIARGIEARLIEAEALLNADHNDASGAFLKKLNDLRADVASHGVTGLSALSNPGSFDGRVNLLYRESAFWLYGEYRRIGALRRLMRLYGRPSESVWPTGTYSNPFTGVTGLYGQATNTAGAAYYETNNPYVGGGCTSRTD